MQAILMNVLPIILMLGLFYAIIFIPESKRRKKYNQMIDNLKVNDEILTRGGIIGKIISIKDDYVILESGPDRARVKLSKQGISNVMAQSTDTESK